MTLPQADRDRLAEWMGWERREHDYDVALRPGATDTARGHLWYDGDEFVAWGENFLNPPDWREAGMLLERAAEKGWEVWLGYERVGYDGDEKAWFVLVSDVAA